MTTRHAYTHNPYTYEANHVPHVEHNYTPAQQRMSSVVPQHYDEHQRRVSDGQQHNFLPYGQQHVSYSSIQTQTNPENLQDYNEYRPRPVYSSPEEEYQHQEPHVPEQFHGQVSNDHQYYHAPHYGQVPPASIPLLSQALANGQYAYVRYAVSELHHQLHIARQHNRIDILTTAVTELCASTGREPLLLTVVGRILMGAILPQDPRQAPTGMLCKALQAVLQSHAMAMMSTQDGSAILYHLANYSNLAEPLARALFNRGPAFTAVHLVEKKHTQHRLKAVFYNIINRCSGDSALLLLQDVLEDIIRWLPNDLAELYVPIPESELQSASEPLDCTPAWARLDQLAHDAKLMYGPIKEHTGERSNERRTQQSEHTIVEALYHKLCECATWGRFQKRSVTHITEILGMRGETKGNSRPYSLCVINSHTGHSHTFVHMLLERDLIALCCCKAASVIQQIVYTYPKLYLPIIVQRLTENPYQFAQVLCNSYGNYVITSILQVAAQFENGILSDHRDIVENAVRIYEQHCVAPPNGCEKYVIDYLNRPHLKPQLSDIGTRKLLQLDGQR